MRRQGKEAGSEGSMDNKAETRRRRREHGDERAETRRRGMRGRKTRAATRVRGERAGTNGRKRGRKATG